MYVEIIMRHVNEHINILFQIKSELLQTLSIGDNHIIRVPETGEEFTVTLIDANHCPGSVMFLFQGEHIVYAFLLSSLHSACTPFKLINIG
jgi:Cft2 family RNA processing exonuclease